ncbi:MAG: hypothetical protein ACYDAQ_08630 [Mycobacteriales bacterium]
MTSYTPDALAVGLPAVRGGMVCEPEDHVGKSGGGNHAGRQPCAVRDVRRDEVHAGWARPFSLLPRPTSYKAYMSVNASVLLDASLAERLRLRARAAGELPWRA